MIVHHITSDNTFRLIIFVFKIGAPRIIIAIVIIRVLESIILEKQRG